jgi:DNA-binding transcriptional MerR regulator
MPEHPSKIYWSIGEVAAMFDVNESLLRYWEKEFDIIKPKKNSKGTRSYTKDDIEAIKLIFHLVKEKKMTLTGAKSQIKSQKRIVSSKIEATERLKKVREGLLELKTMLSEIDPEEDD